MSGCHTTSLDGAESLNPCRAPPLVSNWPTGWVETWFAEPDHLLHQAHDGEALQQRRASWHTHHAWALRSLLTQPRAKQLKS